MYGHRRLLDCAISTHLVLKREYPGELDRCRCCWCHSCLRHQVMVGHDISFLRSARHCLSGEGIWTFFAFLLLITDQNCKGLLDFPTKCRTRRVNPNPTVILLFNCMILRLTRCEWRAIWWQKCGWKLVRIIACCLTTSHYPNQCWLISSEVLWYSPESDLTTSAWGTILCNDFDDYTFKITTPSPREKGVKINNGWTVDSHYKNR